MNLQALQQVLSTALPHLACPRCGSAFALVGTSLKCAANHCYDLCAKGYVNLAPQHDQTKEKYDAALFQSRARILAGGFYQPVLDAVSRMIARKHGDAAFTLVDAGCGEGFYTRQLAQRFPAATMIGLDLSRDGIRAAARQVGKALWLVADLKQLPLADHQTDVVLDVFTPANYEEFHRVLKPDGELIKVIPDADYLAEIRTAFQLYLRQEGYSNQQVLDHLAKHADILEQAEIRQTFSLTQEDSRCFLSMTPMGFSVPEEVLVNTTLSEITLHLQVLRCKVHTIHTKRAVTFE